MTANDEIWAKETERDAAARAPGGDPFDRAPDLWWSYGDRTDQRMCYWYFDGAWHWRKIDSAGTIVAHGEGGP